MLTEIAVHLNDTMGHVDQVLATFEAQSHMFWMFLLNMSAEDKQQSASSHVYHQVLQTTFNIAYSMREELMRADGNCRRYDSDVVCDRVV